MNIWSPAKLNLKTKLILLYFATIFIPLVVTGQIILTVSGHKIIAQTTAITEESSTQTARNIQNLLDQYVNLVNRLVFDPALANYLNVSRVYKSDLESIDAYDLYLKPVTFYDFNFKEPSASLKIYFLNETLLQDGNTFIHADKDTTALAEYKAAVAASGEAVWGTDQGNVFVARSMFNMQRQLIAVVAIRIPASRISGLLQEKDKSGTSMLVTTRQGDVITANASGIRVSGGSAGGSISGEPYFVPDAAEPFDVSDGGSGEPYKAVVKPIGDGKYYPDWQLLTLIPLNRLIDDERHIRRTGLIVISLGLLVSCCIFLLSLGRITARLKALVDKMGTVRKGELSVIADSGAYDEIGVLTQSYNRMIESLQQLIYDNYEANLKLKDITIKKQEAELYALQNQINPHFLFNTLESIRMGLHNKGDDETAVIVLNLSKLFRYSLSWQGELIRLREELELVSRYLSIQKYRFEQKISYRIELPEPLADAWIPRFTVQPVVENAVKHGLESIRENGYLTVRVTTAREADAETMAIVVEDNGAGIQAQTLVHIREALASGEMRKTGSIGLKNVHDRIALHYGAGYGVAVESEPEQGTRVTITIPALYDIPAKKEEPHHVQDTDRR